MRDLIYSLHVFILNCIGISVVQSALAVLAVTMLFQSIPNLNFSPLHAHRVSEAILGICSFAQCSRGMAPRSSTQPPASKKPRLNQEDEIMFEDLNTDDGVSTNNSDSTLPLDGKSNGGKKGRRKSAGSSGGAAGLGRGHCMMPSCALEKKSNKSRFCRDHQTHYDMLRYKKAKEFGTDEPGKAKLKEWVQRMKDWCCSACLCFFCFVLCSLIR